MYVFEQNKINGFYIHKSYVTPAAYAILKIPFILLV